MRPRDDLADRVDRADRVAGISDRDELRSRPELRFEVLEVEGDVVEVDVDGLDDHAPVVRHRPPGADVGLVVERRDHDLVARTQGRPDRSPDMERQARHVLAELDLVRARRPEEVGDRGVGLIDDRVAEAARRERPARVGIRVAVVATDRVDDPLRNLRPTGSVEERHRSAVLLASEGPGTGPGGRRRRRRASGLLVVRVGPRGYPQAMVRQPAIERWPTAASELDRGQPGPDDHRNSSPAATRATVTSCSSFVSRSATGGWRTRT